MARLMKSQARITCTTGNRFAFATVTSATNRPPPRDQVWPMIGLGAIFVAAAVAQKKVYGRRIALLETELARIGNEKSLLQQELTDHRLQRTAALK